MRDDSQMLDRSAVFSSPVPISWKVTPFRSGIFFAWIQTLLLQAVMRFLFGTRHNGGGWHACVPRLLIIYPARSQSGAEIWRPSV